MSFRRLRVSSAQLNAFLRNCTLYDAVLPIDIRVTGVSREDPPARFFVFTIESKQFPKVGEGAVVDFIRATFKRKPRTE